MMQADQGLRRSPNRMPFWGMFCGMAVMLGLPLVTLTAGANLADWVQLVLVLMGILVGGVMAATATFFGIVLPYARARFARYWGLFSGMTVILGLPLLVLSKGDHLAEWMQVVLIVLAILVGSVMALTSIFFGILIPQAQAQMAARPGMGACFFNQAETTEQPGVRVSEDGVHVQEGAQHVRVDESGVHVSDGKQTVSVSSAGVKVEGGA